MPTPEELICENIDRQLTACGWIVKSSNIPRVNFILDLLGRENHDIAALGWEYHTHEKWATPGEYIASSLTPSRPLDPDSCGGGADYHLLGKFR